MSTLTFLAAGLTAAAWFSSRLGRGLPNRLHQLAPARADAPPDSRGITLQTLIVTAVLVLMAVAAGVVIVAITSSSSDDLEESGTDVEARCNSVEIYDAQVAARNELGIHEGSNFQGSAIGCIPVCILTAVPMPLDAPKITADIFGFSRGPSDIPPLDTSQDGMVSLILIAKLLPTELQAIARLINVPTQIPFLLATGEVEDGSVTVHIQLHEDFVVPAQVNAPSRSIPDSGLTTAPVPVDPRIDRIAVAPNQNQCLAYDAAGEPILP